MRLVNTVFSPGTVMEELKEEPSWVGPLLVAGLLVVVSTLLLPKELTLEMMRLRLIESDSPVPDNLDRIVEITRSVGLIAAVAFMFVFAFFIAGVATVIFAFVLGDDGRYKQYLAVVSHALIITALGALLTTPLRIAAEDIQLTLGLGTFAQAFLPEGYMLNVLHSLDLFSLWTYGVIAIGVTKIDPRRSWLSAFLALMFLALSLAMLLALAR